MTPLLRHAPPSVEPIDAARSNRALATRMAIPTRRWLRASITVVSKLWSLCGISLLMIVAIELLATAWLRVTDRSGMSEDPRVHADGYRDADWVEAYFQEFNAANHVAWRPFVYWRREPFHGRFVNIDEQGLRKTWNPPAPASDRAPRIFIFGGSTMWGTGARDDFTIASWLAKLLAEHGHGASVTNFGEGGYVSMQELIALETELQQGNIPDLVVFLDGVNDVFAAFQNGAPGIPQNERNRVREFNIDQRIYREALQTWFKDSAVFALFAPAPSDAAPRAVGLDQLSAAVIERYVAVVGMIDNLAHAYHFRTQFYWQPVIFTKQHLTSYEKGEWEKQSLLASFYQNVYGQAQVRSTWPVRYLGDLFGDDPNPYFIDFCHLTESGNERIARAMVDDVSATLGQPAP